MPDLNFSSGSTWKFYAWMERSNTKIFEEITSSISKTISNWREKDRGIWRNRTWPSQRLETCGKKFSNPRENTTEKTGS